MRGLTRSSPLDPVGFVQVKKEYTMIKHYTESRFHIVGRDGYHHGSYLTYEGAKLWRNFYAPNAAIILRDTAKSYDSDGWKKPASPSSPDWEYRQSIGSSLGMNG